MGHVANSITARPVMINGEPQVLLEVVTCDGQPFHAALATHAAERLIGKMTAALGRLMLPPEEINDDSGTPQGGAPPSEGSAAA